MWYKLMLFWTCIVGVFQGKKGPGIAKMGKEIAAEADRLDVKDKAVGILAELLCDDHLLTQIPLYKNLFLRVSVP